ncbi:DUF1778 domain-containing protein [Immundisolibacter sp.]|uniref:type II toxin -antitoxin system TacA 1-like antitoxin n=1 Tax=Immundisolibacter sp. TaxID=1934948 RepID=UPI00344097D2
MPGWVRIALRMTPDPRGLQRRAAEVAGMPVSTFVLHSACQAAGQLLVEQQLEIAGPTVESLPTFTKPACQRWESIPADIRQRLVWAVRSPNNHHQFRRHHQGQRLAAGGQVRRVPR